jgi:GR25 family glycosyltransferase involved in LPS biosynthesis
MAMAGTKVAPCLVRGSNGDGHAMRSFEIPACGAFMLAERTDEHLELFEEGVHAAYCETPEELREKARYYIAHDSARVRMAGAAYQQVTSGGHRYRDRLSELLSFTAGRRPAARPIAAPAMPTFVINLKRSRDRREAMTTQCAAVGIQPSFVEAHDGAAAGGPVTNTLSETELGCLMSHRAIWQRIVDDDIPAACVLEDDCRLDRNIVSLLQAIDRERHRWDLVLLGHHSSRYGSDAGAATCYRGISLSQRYRLAQVAEFAMGAYAYVLTLAGARQLLALADPPRMPADWVTGYAPVAGARLFAVTPPCVWPDPVLALETTMHDRWNGSSALPAPATTAGVVRRLAGNALLFSRKLGFRANAYVKRF